MNSRVLTTTAAILALALALVSTVTAETAFTLTNTLTVDTRGAGNLSVTGRVLNAQTRLPLAGATITLAGLNTTTASNGTFTLANVDLTAGSTLTVGKTGFLTQTRTVAAAQGVKAVSVGDIELVANTDKPVVEWVKPDIAGLFSRHHRSPSWRRWRWRERPAGCPRR
jgi:hypothetical protein